MLTNFKTLPKSDQTFYGKMFGSIFDGQMMAFQVACSKSRSLLDLVRKY